MKKIIVASLLLVAQLVLNVATAQELKVIKPVFEACKSIREAVASGSSENLQSANQDLKNCNAKELNMMRLKKGEVISLDGHLLFDEVFVDSLIVNRKVFTFAQRYANDRAGRVRGSGEKNQIYIRTYAVKAKSALTFSFVARGYQELAVVAEPGGAVSLSIYDKTNKIPYRDTKNVKRGEAHRSFALNLPESKMNQLEIEITNTTDKDISFVVIVHS